MKYNLLSAGNTLQIFSAVAHPERFEQIISEIIPNCNDREQITCLLKSDECSEVLKDLNFTDNILINKALLSMIDVYYEAKTLKENQNLLEDINYIKCFCSFMWNKEQILLLSFFYSNHYDHQFIYSVLSYDYYVSTVYQLMNMGLMQDVPKLFQNSDKLKQLKYIYGLTEVDTIKLCLIFWVKGALSLDDYQSVVSATAIYPLMAATLNELDKKKFVSVDVLKQLALNPFCHLRKSIKHHFFSAPNEQFFIDAYFSGLDKSHEAELKATSQALTVLKNSGITEPVAYRAVINNKPSAKVLRIFLPQLADLNNVDKRKILIRTLYPSSTFSSDTQIENRPFQDEINTLHKRFLCVNHLQALDFSHEILKWVAEENNEKAKNFRQIVSRVEAHEDVINSHLSGSKSSRLMYQKWEEKKLPYRKELYMIAYEALMNVKDNAHVVLDEAKQKIREAEKNILNIMAPPKKSALHQALIIMTNLLITLLTLGIANLVKLHKTHNPWFFTQSKLSDELHALTNDLIASVTP